MMPDLANIAQLTRAFVDIANDNESFDHGGWCVFDSFASTYRSHCETSAKIVLDDLAGYPDIQQLTTIQATQCELGLSPRHRREAFRYYTEWAYRYGAKAADNPELPDTDYDGEEPYTTIQAHAEDIVKSGDATVNDMALVFRLTHEYFSVTRDTFNPDAPLLEFYDCVYDEVANLVEMKGTNLNWNMLAGLLDKGRNLADQDTMVALGRKRERRELLSELQETDLTLDEWLAQHAVK